MRETSEGPQVKREIILHDSPVQILSATGEQKPQLGYLGPEGTYTQQAGLELLADQADYQATPRITEVIKLVDSGAYDIGLVPIENSTEGNVVETIREIIRSNVSILGEKVIPIHHSLIGSEEALTSGVVHSHPQAIGQCANWLEQNFPGVQVVTQNSTAEAVRIAVSRGELAIGSSISARLYGAEVLRGKIEDFPGNTTRFWLIGRGETAPTDQDRTTLLFSLRNQVGLLSRSLAVFADRGINLTKIDSFPINALDEYYFLLTIDGHKKNPQVADALKEFSTTILKVKNFGSYHKDAIPEKVFDSKAMADGWLIPDNL